MADKSMKLGGGGRFAAIEKSAESRGASEASARKIAASAGIRKYGKRAMSRMSSAGRKRSGR